LRLSCAHKLIRARDTNGSKIKTKATLGGNVRKARLQVVKAIGSHLPMLENLLFTQRHVPFRAPDGEEHLN
jgi:hypothetical protein